MKLTKVILSTMELKGFIVDDTFRVRPRMDSIGVIERGRYIVTTTIDKELVTLASVWTSEYNMELIKLRILSKGRKRWVMNKLYNNILEKL